MQVLDIVPHSDEWYEARCGIPTVSEFGRIITPKTGALSARADEYIAELIAESVEGPQARYLSYDMARGMDLESEARDWYSFQHDVEVAEGGVVLNHGAGWSPDGRFDKAAVEIKCPQAKTHVKYLLAGGLPDEYRPQCHGALWVGELDWIDFVSYHPSFKPLVVRVEPDAYTEKVGKALKQFIDRYGEARRAILE